MKKSKKELSKTDAFYIRHLVRETLLLVEYDQDNQAFIETIDVFKEKYGDGLINKMINEIVKWKKEGYKSPLTPREKIAMRREKFSH